MENDPAEYRAYCENGDLYGYGAVQPQRDGTFTVTLHADYREVALAAGYGAQAGDFPIEETFGERSRAHRSALDYAEALIAQAKKDFESEFGEDSEGAYHVQGDGDAYLLLDR